MTTSTDYLSNIPCLYYCQIKSFDSKLMLSLKLKCRSVEGPDVVNFSAVV